MKSNMMWSETSLIARAAEDNLSLKIESRCKECGKVFVKYAYERTARCETCRKEAGKRSTIVSLPPRR